MTIRGILVVLLVGLLAPAGITAQEPIVPLQLSLSDPGARSMGLGGAFVALADDATAAFSNPAGLVQLARPEVSIEGRSWSYSTPFTERGRVEGLPSGFGIDTVEGLRRATSGTTLSGVSFLSVAYPGENWTLAFFRHQLANFEFSSETQGLFGGGSRCCQTRFWDQRVTTDLDFVTYGLSGAYRVHERLDLGFGVLYHQTSLFARATVFLWDEDTLESFFSPTSFLPSRSLLSQTLVSDDSSWGLAGGFLWRVTDSWRIGGVYRQGPETDIVVEATAGQALDPGVAPGTVLGRIPGVAIDLPSVFGLGFAYRSPDGSSTVSFQWDRIDYSRITDSPGLEDVVVDDADELHLGGEYVFVRSTPIVAVRVGVWLDPDHEIRATVDEPLLRALQPRGDDEIHYAAGLGIAFRRYQIDLGVDLADRVDTLALSAIYSF